MQKKKNKVQKIAIIGSGISGLSAAYFLSDKYQVKIFEKHDYLGGHSNTVDVKYGKRKIAVDTGFIVFNKRTYPNLLNFFHLLNVDYEASNMSFAVKINEGSLEYAGTNLASVFAQPKNILNISFLKMLRDILHFNKASLQLLEKKFDAKYNLEKLLKDLGVGDYFINYYLLPMAGAIWSCPTQTMLKYPAQSFLKFFKNHGLLTVQDQPQWYTVSGGSREYVKKIAKKVGSKNIVLNSFVYKVTKNSDETLTVESDEGKETFDKVVIATHPDQSLKMLIDADSRQVDVLSSFKYQKNLAILHKDRSVMPNAKKAWASWVYSKNDDELESDNPIAVTYWMNNLQNIDSQYPLFVTLNPNTDIKKSDIFDSFIYEHPIFDSAAIKAQKELPNIQGINNIYFCGAYHANGFHEDGISSALRVVKSLGVKIPW